MTKRLRDAVSSRRYRWIGPLIVVLLVVYAGFQALVAFWHWPGPHEESVVVMVPKGAGISHIATVLYNAGILAYPLAFRLGVELTGFNNPLKAGEYRIRAWTSMADIAAQLRAGRSLQHRITIPEGLTVRQIADLIREKPDLEGEIETLPPEGSLLPETYYFERGTTRQEILTRMAAAHDKIVQELWPQRAGDLPFDTPGEAVILASIVGKETSRVAEKPLIAAVFVNRLRRGMRLQSDPTIIYGVTDGFGVLGRPIRRSEIRKNTPYNTYRIYGLPPTPIANPGADSIAAVLHPAETSHLYFVADGKGGHNFSNTLAEHNRQVSRWRRLKRR